MARPKISLLAAGAVIVVVAAACGGTAANAASATEPTSTASPTAIALASPSSTPVASTSATVSPTAAPTPELLAGTVVEVVDGDTIHVQLPSGVEKVRIIGIDTPETVDPNRPASCFGPEATAFAKETLAGKPVTLELDPTQDRRDRFDRLLAHVHVGDALYAAEAIAGGYGIHYIYEVPSIHAAELAAAEASAKAANLGIWAVVRGPRRPAPVGRARAHAAARRRRLGAAGRLELPSLVHAVRAQRRPRPRLQGHRLQGHDHRPRRVPPRRLRPRRPGLRELRMRRSGPDSRTLVTWALFAQIVFGILVLMAALIAFVGPLRLPIPGS